MTSLYIDKKDAVLNVEASRLVVKTADKAQSLPFKYIDRVVICAKTHFDSRVLAALDDANIPVIVIDWRRDCVCWAGGWHHGDTKRRLQQYSLSQKPELCAEQSRRLVGAKLQGQCRHLLSLRKNRAQQRRALTLGVSRIEAITKNLAGANIESLRGMEGAAAREYFGALKTVFAESLGFTHRNRRPPRDPVNAVLSLSYTLLHSEALHVLYRVGLDPSVGFYHDASYGRAALACDLMEPFRYQVDAWVYALFSQQILTNRSFTSQQNACLLGKAGRKTFYENWEQFAPQVRPRILSVGKNWAACVKQSA